MSIDSEIALESTSTWTRQLERERKTRLQAESIAEKVTRELYEKQRELELLQRIAAAANESSETDQVLAFALREVCLHMGWPVGHIYISTLCGELHSTGIWYLEAPDRFEYFRRITERTLMSVGEDLPGRVAQTRSPAWIRDVTQDTNFPRAKAAVDIGVRSAFAFPVQAGAEVAAVLEFFSPRILEPGPRFLEGIAHIGTQLGRVLERERAESILRSSEERFRAVFEAGSIGIGLVSSDTTILDANATLCAMLGYTREEIRGMRFGDLTHPEDRELDEANAARLFRGEIQSYQIEKRYLTKTGELVWGLLTASIARHHEREDSLGIGIVQDITERKTLEQQLRQSQKMEAVGSLAGGIAHDFNNLLNVILGYGEMVLTSLPDADPQKKRIDQIVKAGKRAASLTRQLLAFSRKQIVEPRLLDLNVVLQEIHTMLRRLIGEDIELVTALAQDLGTVKADPGQIEQVLLNLVVNARDAMPTGGTMTLETANVELDSTYTQSHAGSSVGPHVMFAVSDTGIGMAPEVQSRIFEPFFTTKEPGKGTGLGLATVYGIVKQSGGSIWVYSETGQGTTFKVYLPRVDERPEILGPAPDRSSIAGTETILVVEDEEQVRQVIQDCLESNGYRVIVASEADEALRICSELPEHIDLLVTDVVLRGMNGREVAREAVIRRPALKVLFISGYTDDAVVRHGVLNRDVAFLQKPFTLTALSRKVREVIEAVHMGTCDSTSSIDKPDFT